MKTLNRSLAAEHAVLQDLEGKVRCGKVRKGTVGRGKARRGKASKQISNFTQCGEKHVLSEYTCPAQTIQQGTFPGICVTDKGDNWQSKTHSNGGVVK